MVVTGVEEVRLALATNPAESESKRMADYANGIGPVMVATQGGSSPTAKGSIRPTMAGTITKLFWPLQALRRVKADAGYAISAPPSTRRGPNSLLVLMLMNSNSGQAT